MARRRGRLRHVGGGHEAGAQLVDDPFPQFGVFARVRGGGRIESEAGHLQRFAVAGDAVAFERSAGIRRGLLPGACRGPEQQADGELQAGGGAASCCGAAG